MNCWIRWTTGEKIFAELPPDLKDKLLDPPGEKTPGIVEEEDKTTGREIKSRIVENKQKPKNGKETTIVNVEEPKEPLVTVPVDNKKPVLDQRHVKSQSVQHPSGKSDKKQHASKDKEDTEAEELEYWKALREKLKKDREEALEKVETGGAIAQWIQREEAKIGKKLLVHTSKYDSGKLKEQYTYYLKGNSIVRHGKWKKWSVSAHFPGEKWIYGLTQLTNFSHGKAHGYSALWDIHNVSGQNLGRVLQVEGYYKDGKENGLWINYTGLDKWSEVSYRNGLKEGVEYIYYNDGAVDMKKSYKAGKMHGPWTSWWPDGHIKLAGQYKDDKLDGEWIEWEKLHKGYRKIVTNYKDGYFHGVMIRYKENGLKLKEVNFRNGREHGISKEYYSKHNKVEWQTKWVNGEMVHLIGFSLTRKGKYYKFKEVDFITRKQIRWEEDGTVHRNNL